MQCALYELLICQSQQGGCVVVINLHHTASFPLVFILQHVAVVCKHGTEWYIGAAGDDCRQDWVVQSTKLSEVQCSTLFCDEDSNHDSANG